ncbi:MAG: hypothetical protein HQK77_01065 [Desulfobacterales bacterium]|nr:hypothetical protein [Desulfobacterales bacterium]
MKKILITQYFRKVLKKFKNHFNEQDIVSNIKEFMRIGFRKGEAKLTTELFDNITVEIVKLRIHVHNSVGRYLIGIIDKSEYLPIFIDLKTGHYGKNMSFNSDKKITSMLESAIENTLFDYLEHTKENQRLVEYIIEEQ